MSALLPVFSHLSRGEDLVLEHRGPDRRVVEVDDVEVVGLCTAAPVAGFLASRTCAYSL